MAIIKSKHAGNFTVLPNEIFNSKLSVSAIGMLAYILSLPHDWVIRKTQLMDKFSIGKDALRTVLNELEVAGYFLCVKKHGEKGTFEYNYIVYDKPFNGEIMADLPQAVEPTMVEPPLDKPTTTKETIILKTNYTKDTSSLDFTKLDSDSFLNWFNLKTGKKYKSLSSTSKNNLKKIVKLDYAEYDWNVAIENLKANKWAIETDNIAPVHFLREDNFLKYVNKPLPQLKQQVKSIAEQIAEMNNA